jgi:Cu+-exporting ATPase
VKNGTLIASLSLHDELRPEAATVIKKLQALGVSVSMISGDRAQKCADAAADLGITAVYAEKLPEEKLVVIRELQADASIAYVGDGINDAPTLAEASVGISLSSASDVARHSAQLVLTGNTLSALPAAISLARLTVQTIKQNLFWAFFYNITTIPLAALGYIAPLAGALMMTASDVVIVANSLQIKLRKLRGA